MQAILTRVLPATNTKPTRIVASCARGRLVCYPMTVDEAGHKWSADMLTDKFCRDDLTEYSAPIASNPWNKPRVCGCLPNGDFAHVFVS